MTELIFSTGNDVKYRLALQTCKGYGIKLVQKRLDIDEIQAEEPEKIARDKAAKAYGLIKEPVVISDDSWSFVGLKGFPGPYMSSMNHWLAPEDFLRLTSTLKDRSVILSQYIVYQNQDEQKVFSAHSKGELLNEPRGTSVDANHTIITMAGDKGLSIAEVYNSGADNSQREVARLWKQFALWHNEHI